MHEATAYNPAFYDQQASGSAESAGVMLSLLFERHRPTSVVDVGCGVGTWLAVCRLRGVDTTLGLDGDYVDRSMLRIPASDFVPTDITDAEAVAQATGGRSYDLAISLEVAEHFDRSHAEAFVSTLTKLSDAVLFSAAIPYQGGTSHVNECWPEFWAILFRAAGYEVVDLFRPRLWSDQRVSFWYRQNALLFVRTGSAAAAKFAGETGARFPLSVVHPELLTWACSRHGRVPEEHQERDRLIHESLHAAYAAGATTPPHLNHAYGREFDYRYGGLAARIPQSFRRAAKAALRLVK